MSIAPFRRRFAARQPAPAELLAALPIPTLAINPEGAPAQANLAAESLFNTSQAMMRERGWAGMVSDPASLARRIAEARGRDGTADYDVELALPGGRSVRVDLLLASLPDSPGWLVLSLPTRAVASLVSRALVHQGAARVGVGVAALLAHEIKNPLAGIRGAAQLIAQTADADARELTGLITAEVDRVAALVDRMEDFTDTRRLARAPENIHAILGHVRALMVSGAGATIRERYDPSLPAVFGNRDALIQVFLNLVKNASEAVGGQGEITLTTAYRAGLKVAEPGSGRRVSLPLEICVIDTGPGVPAELGERMFDPFVSSKRGGRGLGLALVAKLVGDHGGIVEYERAGDPPRTIFRVLLPTGHAT